ncbi:MAG: spore germination protein [Christensenellales bacterium]
MFQKKDIYTPLLERFKQLKQVNRDVIIRQMKLPPWGLDCALIFMEANTDGRTIEDAVVQPLLRHQSKQKPPKNIVDYVVAHVLYAGVVDRCKDEQDAIDRYFGGFTIFLIQGMDAPLFIEARGGMRRGIDAPELDRTLLGAHEGFVENLQTNCALMRRRIKDPRFVISPLQIGTRTKSQAALYYMDGIADPKTVREMRRRLEAIDVDAVPGTNALHGFLCKHPSSLFPQARIAENPDIVCADLLEGRVAVILDQYPYALIMPILFVELFQTPDEYAQKTVQSGLIRMLRLFGFFLAILLPGIYLALMNFNPELIPVKMLLTLSRFTRQVPMTVLLEILLVEVMLELIYEATVRLPGAVSSTVGIVGGIILGQSLVDSRLASTPTMIIVTLSLLGSFALPNYALSLSCRLLRVFYLFASALMGLYALPLGLFLIIAHLNSLNNYGANYLSPFSPFVREDLKDSFVQQPFTQRMTRPRSIPNHNPIRQRRTRKEG